MQGKVLHLPVLNGEHRGVNPSRCVEVCPSLPALLTQCRELVRSQHSALVFSDSLPSCGGGTFCRGCLFFSLLPVLVICQSLMEGWALLPPCDVGCNLSPVSSLMLNLLWALSPQVSHCTSRQKWWGLLRAFWDLIGQQKQFCSLYDSVFLKLFNWVLLRWLTCLQWLMQVSWWPEPI